MDYYTLKKEDVLKELKTGFNGLSNTEAKKRIVQYGSNVILKQKTINPFFLFIQQFNSALIYILIIAAVISYIFGHIVDVYIIAIVILINSLIGFLQSYRAEKSIDALRKLIVSYAKVYRDGKLTKLKAEELIPGDVILLEQGDKVPADCRLLELKNLQTVESSLTGESFPIDKKDIVLSQKTPISDMVNMVFMGTFISNGSCKAVVVATDNETVIGKLAKELQSVQHPKSHFSKKTNILAKQMAAIAVIGALITFLIGYFIRGFEFAEILLFTIASLVSSIPEGLPAVLAIVLAIGAFRMSKRNALIRKLPATETLGVVTTIITDKTGTITENVMSVEKIIMPGYPEISITGTAWIPKGEFIQIGKRINPSDNLQLTKLLAISKICNNSRLLKESDNYSIIGDPTEAALLVLGEKSKMSLDEEKIDDIPFNSELKYRASLVALVKEDNIKQIYVVGAPEEIINYSSHFLNKNAKKILSKKDISEIMGGIDKLTKGGMRVLALAYKNTSADIKSISKENINGLTIVGIVGIMDPPRPEVKEAIERAKKAGIRVIMATGDHKGTALSVSKEIGLVDNNYTQVFTESELKSLSEKEFSKVVMTYNIFARLTPDMKLRIASELQAQGETIAMTGDGVNDALAIKRADIGIAMGVIGTDVARESAELVLVDDNFASIINAIEEGRIVFTNTRQASFFLITTNFAENATIILSLLVGMPLPLLPTQILWLNLVTDTGSGVSLAVEPSYKDVLHEKPRNPKENILSKEIIPFLAIMVATMVALTYFIFNYFLAFSVESARTAAFSVMAFTQLFNLFNMRSLKKSIFKIGFLSNKYSIFAFVLSVLAVLAVIYIPLIQKAFNFVPIAFTSMILIFILSSLVLVFGEIYKFAKKKF
ncbi:MAG: HAD-IC family P-type ATPase [Candidatus Pacearchaeota archaeon]